ncbi:MAG: flagellar biosynthesis protein FlhA [Burkholderiales bacterium]|nr:flagellar biosynthesis protein FlhA [Burkholderiales bacterium]
MTLVSFLRSASPIALGVPLAVIAIVAMMVLPLPPFLLDLLFTFNIAASLVVLLAAVYAARPLDFAAFPTVLLLATLLRLSLNVASTRVVLMHGHTGTDAAGKVIESFGTFLIGGNFAVGLVVFLILVVINFVVITKGAGRIAEVAARFTLDAMPGKQMAIDADLNAGLIGEAEARRRRAAIAAEAEFYGAMDGASKFVRGDAIAGILILVINVVGGLAIGVLQHHLPLEVAADRYVLLAVGDGLVAQVPALVISTAAGLLVSRVAGAEGEDVGAQIARQLLGSPRALAIAAALVGALGLVPGMPHVAFLTLAGALGWAAWRLERRAQVAPPPAPAAEAKPAEEASWDDVVPVDAFALEVGYRLVPLVDSAHGGELLKRIRAIRRKFAQEVGFLPPAVHIRDNLELRPGAYRILLKGVAIGEGEVIPGQFLAIDPGGAGAAAPPLKGTPTSDPAFGLPALWIEPGERDAALARGYTVVDAGAVIATHVSHLMHSNAAALLGRNEMQQLLEQFARYAPKLVEDVVPKLVPVALVQRVLQNLLEEGVYVRDLRTILETIAEHAPRTQDAGELTALVRIALGPAITQQVFGPAKELPVLALEPELERLLGQSAAPGEAIEPGLAEALAASAAAAARKLEALGLAPALVVADRLRAPLARLLKRAVPRLRVLCHAELPGERTVRVVQTLGARA